MKNANHRSLSLRLTAATCALTVLTTSLTAAISSTASANPNPARFDADTLERSMLDFYCYFPDQDLKECPEATFGKPRSSKPDAGQAADPDAEPALAPGVPGAELAPVAQPALNPAELSAYAIEIFDHAALLDTAGFNDVIVHLSSDYRNHPEHRAAIEMLLDSYTVQSSADKGADAVRERLRAEIKGDRERNDIVTVIDGVVVVFSIGYAFRFGKGAVNGTKSLWLSRGKGLAGVKRFRDSIEVFQETMKEAKIIQSIAGKRMINYKNLGGFGLKLGGGTALGLAKVVYDSLQTYKIDPRHALDPIRKDIVLELGTFAAEKRDELRARIQETPTQLFAHLKAQREYITQVDLKVTSAKNQLEHLYTVAAELRPDMRPIAEDLTEIRGNLAKLGALLDDAELNADPDLAPAPSNPGHTQLPFSPLLGASRACQAQSLTIQAELLQAAKLSEPLLAQAASRNRAAIREILSGIPRAGVSEFYSLRYSALHEEKFESLVARLHAGASRARAGKSADPLSDPLRSITTQDFTMPRTMTASAVSVVSEPVTLNFRGQSVSIRGLQVISRQSIPGYSVADEIVPTCDFPSAYADREPTGATESTVDGQSCEAFVQQFLTAECGGKAN